MADLVVKRRPAPTTIAWPGTAGNLLCEAHKRGIRLVASDSLVARPPISGSASLRAKWVKATLAKVQAEFLDGIVFDWEEPAAAASEQARWYAELVNETSAAFHASNPSLQVSTCVAWSPEGVDGRAYDYARLAAASDALYVMDYDTRSQVVDACLAAANAPLAGTSLGLRRYLDLGIPPGKLILGVPWYGYRYPCLPGTKADARFCPIASVPFRGVNCSDAAGSEVPFDEIVRRLRSANTTTELRWDTNQQAPYFNALENRTVVQYWFDDARSVGLKVRVAEQLGLRGVGPYQFVDTADESMWAALAGRRPSSVHAGLARAPGTQSALWVA